MRVENNIFALSNNFGIYNNRKKENRTYISTGLSSDTVSFTGRRPKDFVKAVGDAKKAVAKATKGTGKRHIKNAFHAQLNPESQKQVENMHKNFQVISEFFERLKTNPPRAEKIKDGYLPIIKGTKKQGLTFRMPFPEDGKTITISKSRNEKDLMRIVITDTEGKETHFLLDGLDKVVGNLNKKNPRFMPPKFRYMTAEELDRSGAKLYINYANSELENFAKYLEKVSSEQPIKTRKKVGTDGVTTSTLKPITRAISPALTREQSIVKLFGIFEKGADEIPTHINPQVSPSSRKVVAFSIKTEDGGTLKVSKRMNPEYGSQLRYVTLEKISPEGYKHFISIDFETKEFLKCDSTNGKPKIVKDAIFSYTPAEIKEYNIENKLNSYMEEIFRASKETDAPHEVTILKLKERPQAKRNIEDMDVSEFEDKRVTAQVAKEQKLAQEQPQAPAIEPEVRGTEKVAEEIKPVKRRGRKPKVKTETTEQQKTQKPTDGIEKFKIDMLAKATDEANKFADEYFKTFITQFKKAMSEKMSDFQSKLDELFKG